MILSLAKIKHHPHMVQEYRVTADLPDPAAAGFLDFALAGPALFCGAVTNRGGGLFLVEGKYTAQVKLACSRCLAAFTLPVSGEIKAVYGPSAADDAEGELDYRELSGDEIALGGMILDEISFSLPMQPLCNEECRGLCPFCGIDLNSGNCDCAGEQIDPRWEKLTEFRPAGK
ncbi:MAG: DUF177 domain-containing protein [Clostridia bacterium]|nr:DUF177 domain-containing protein [Clostridia bacterium]